MLRDINKVEDITTNDYLRYLNLLNSERMGMSPLRFFFTALWMVPMSFVVGIAISAISSASVALIVSLIGAGVTLPVSSVITAKSAKTYKEIKKETDEHLKEIKELKESGQWEKLNQLMDLYVRKDVDAKSTKIKPATQTKTQTKVQTKTKIVEDKVEDQNELQL